MNAPRFWKTINVISLLLYPISLLYSFGAKIKFLLQNPKKFKFKVICIGNVTSGGSNKTPCAISLGKLLIKQGYKIAYVCRNHSGKSIKSVKITRETYGSYSSGEFIEEAFLLCKVAPVFCANSRLKAFAAANADSDDYDFVIADDGLQNNTFYKDLSILVVNGYSGFGNGMVIPSGPLRESLSSGLKRSDVVFINEASDDIVNQCISAKKRVFHLGSRFYLEKPDASECQYIAFAGIANPERFFDSLRHEGLDVLERIIYPDHYDYKYVDISKLTTKARSRGATLVTTEKDMIKIGAKYGDKIAVLKMDIIIQDEQNIIKIISKLQ